MPLHRLLGVYLCSCINEEPDNMGLSTATGSKERVATVNIDTRPSIQQLTNHGLVVLGYRGAKRRSKIIRTDVGICAVFNQQSHYCRQSFMNRVSKYRSENPS